MLKEDNIIKTAPFKYGFIENWRNNNADIPTAIPEKIAALKTKLNFLPNRISAPAASEPLPRALIKRRLTPKLIKNNTIATVNSNCFCVMNFL